MSIGIEPWMVKMPTRRLADALVSLTLLGWIAACPGTGAAAERTAPEMLPDAELADVCFIDEQTGWAVGDRGVIWHTPDGGKSWKLQDAGVNCRLESVHFLDRQTGWIVGGWTQPYSPESHGVMLRTEDGGQSWQVFDKLLLPALRKAKFFDRKRGWAIGQTSGMFPGGAFATTDGGRTWSPLVADESQAWSAGDFAEPGSGALAAKTSNMYMVRRGTVAAAPAAGFGLQRVHEIQLAKDGRFTGWLVGDNRLVMSTADQGKTWQVPTGDVTSALNGSMDFFAIEVNGTHVWLAGSPGSKILHSSDSGETWESYSTGQSLPIHSIAFINATHGWAVGGLGSILATRDGGRHWEIQRRGGDHAALMSIHGQADELPLEVFARLSAAEGYLSIAQVVGRTDQEVRNTNTATLDDRTHEALVLSGASGAETLWQFPLRQSGLARDENDVVRWWDVASDGMAESKLREILVRQIRIWRPEIIITPAPDKEATPTANAVAGAVLSAVPAAADPSKFSEQISDLELAPWQVKKVFGQLPDGKDGPLHVISEQLVPELEHSFADHVLSARGLISRNCRTAPPRWGFQLLYDYLADQNSGKDFFRGIHLAPRAGARRELKATDAQNFAAVRRKAETRRNLLAIMAGMASDERNSALVSQIAGTLDGLSPQGAGDILHELGRRFYHDGQWDLAAEIFQLLVDQYPKHRLARTATTWLIHYYTSGEVRVRSRRSRDYDVQPAIHTVEAGAAETPLFHEVVPDVAAGKHSQVIVAGREMENRLSRLHARLEREFPQQASEPTIRFPVAARWRKEGFSKQADLFYLALTRSRPRDAWWECAEIEKWLAEPQGIAPKMICKCGFAPSKPFLDGRLGDDAWRSAGRMALLSALRDDQIWPSTAYLVTDGHYLYFAAECKKGPGIGYQSSTVAPRTHDADLARHDRVELLLDIDRDWATYYQFTVDHRGWTSERCWGDSSWNPKWFVAHAESPDAWTVEAAIPLDAISLRRPQPTDVWSVGVQRTVPGLGFQSWSKPAATEILPQGFGLLLFP